MKTRFKIGDVVFISYAIENDGTGLLDYNIARGFVESSYNDGTNKWDVYDIRLQRKSTANIRPVLVQDVKPEDMYETYQGAEKRQKDDMEKYFKSRELEEIRIIRNCEETIKTITEVAAKHGISYTITCSEIQ